MKKQKKIFQKLVKRNILKKMLTNLEWKPARTKMEPKLTIKLKIVMKFVINL